MYVFMHFHISYICIHVYTCIDVLHSILMHDTYYCIIYICIYSATYNFPVALSFDLVIPSPICKYAAACTRSHPLCKGPS